MTAFERTAPNTSTTRSEHNPDLLPAEISGPARTDGQTSARQPHNWLENPLAVTAAAATGGGLGREIVPHGLDLLSSHRFSTGGRWSTARGTLGTELFGEGSAVATNVPRVNWASTEKAVNEVSRAGLQPLANAWRSNTFIPAAQNAAATAAETTATATEAVTGLQGLRNNASQMFGTARSYLNERPALASAGRAALLIGGASLADHYWDSDGYHLAVPGVAIAMTAREGLLAPAAVGLGALAISKVLGPANPDIERIMRPGFSDTALLATAASLPLNGEAQAYTVGGAYVLGRMAHMNSSEAALTSSAVGLAALAKTHNPYVAVAAGTASFLGSRALGWMG